MREEATRALFEVGRLREVVAGLRDLLAFVVAAEPAAQAPDAAVPPAPEGSELLS